MKLADITNRPNINTPTDSLRWAAQQVQPTEKPAGDNEDYTRQAAAILAAANLTADQIQAWERQCKDLWQRTWRDACNEITLLTRSPKGLPRGAGRTTVLDRGESVYTGRRGWAIDHRGGLLTTRHLAIYRQVLADTELENAEAQS